MKTQIISRCLAGRVVSGIAGLLLLPGLAVAQEVYKGKFQKLDELLDHPFENQLITDESYNRLLYRKQVATSGLSVSEGRTLGTSATVSDQLAALNLGGILPTGEKLPNVALIINTRFTADQGFVKLLSNDGAPTGYAYGSTLLLFGDEHSIFRERTKKDLHQKLRDLRKADGTKWATPLDPDTEASLMKRYAPLMADFITKWRAFQQWLKKDKSKDKNGRNRADRFYDNKLTTIEEDDIDGRRLYKEYLEAEHRVMPILNAEWDVWKQQEESSYIRQQVGADKIPPASQYRSLTDTLECNGDFQHTLTSVLPVLNEKTRQARYKVYDSLQQQVKWSSKARGWLTLSALTGNAKQPLFNVANKGQTYADTFKDDYWQLQATGNGVWETEKVSLNMAGGVGTSNQVVFKKSDLLTYQTSRLQDSALVVTQKSLYPRVPPRVRYLNLQTQLTLTANKAFPGLGATAVYEAQLAHNTHALHNITLGIIVPVRAGTSTLLFIPQVRARSADLPNRWSFGFTLTATVPTFLKS